MKKHILFIVENLPVPFDRRVWSEALAVKEWGYNVSIISPKGKGFTKKYEQIEGIRIYRHPMPIEADKKWGFFFEYINALFWQTLLSIKIFFKEPFHIIHGANPPDHIFIIALLFKLFGTKYIFDHHDISTELYLAKYGKPDIFYKILLLIEKINLKAADVVISTNATYKKTAMSRGNKHDREVFIVRNGPDLSRVTVTPSNIEFKEDFDYLVAYIGTMNSQEHVDNLIRIVNYIVKNKNITNTKFIVIGPGTYVDKMIELSEKMNLNKYIEFTGFLPYEKLLGILEQSDICINPEHKNSYTNKSTMLKIMDYMLMGKPIIQFDTIEGKVTADDAAIYIQNNDEIAFAEAIISLLDNQEKRKIMGEIGRKRIYESLNWELQKVNLKQAYKYLEDRLH